MVPLVQGHCPINGAVSHCGVASWEVGICTKIFLLYQDLDCTAGMAERMVIYKFVNIDKRSILEINVCVI